VFVNVRDTFLYSTIPMGDERRKRKKNIIGEVNHYFKAYNVLV